MSPVRLTLISQLIRKIHSCLKNPVFQHITRDLLFTLSPFFFNRYILFNIFNTIFFQVIFVDFFILFFTIFFEVHFFSPFFFTIFFREHFFHYFFHSFSDFNGKKSVPLRGKQAKWVKNMHFLRNGLLFLLLCKSEKKNLRRKTIKMSQKHTFSS